MSDDTAGPPQIVAIGRFLHLVFLEEHSFQSRSQFQETTPMVRGDVDSWGPMFTF